MSLFAGGYLLLYKGHVNVDLIYNRFSPRVQGVISLLTLFVAFFFCGVLVWKGGQYALFAIREGEKTSSIWAPVTWPVRVTIVLGALLLLLQALVKFTRDLELVITGKEPK